jgi:hypothetical protein
MPLFSVRSQVLLGKSTQKEQQAKNPKHLQEENIEIEWIE